MTANVPAAADLSARRADIEERRKVLTERMAALHTMKAKAQTEMAALPEMKRRSAAHSFSRSFRVAAAGGLVAPVSPVSSPAVSPRSSSSSSDDTPRDGPGGAPPPSLGGGVSVLQKARRADGGGGLARGGGSGGGGSFKVRVDGSFRSFKRVESRRAVGGDAVLTAAAPSTSSDKAAPTATDELRTWLIESAGIATERADALVAMLAEQWVSDVATLQSSLAALERHLPAAAYASIARALTPAASAVRAGVERATDSDAGRPQPLPAPTLAASSTSSASVLASSGAPDGVVGRAAPAVDESSSASPSRGQRHGPTTTTDGSSVKGSSFRHRKKSSSSFKGSSFKGGGSFRSNSPSRTVAFASTTTTTPPTAGGGSSSGGGNFRAQGMWQRAIGRAMRAQSEQSAEHAAAVAVAARSRVHADLVEVLRPSPTRLDLSQRGWGTPEVIELAAMLPRFERCAALHLSGNVFDTAGASAIAAVLQGNKALALASLYLDGCGLRAPGLSALLGALETNDTLMELNLDGNQFSERSSGEALCRALKSNVSLTALGLFGCGIDAPGAVLLAEGLEENVTLTTLLMSENRIGDAGGKALASALVLNQSLAVLWLAGNGLSPETVAALERACEVCEATERYGRKDTSYSTSSKRIYNERFGLRATPLQLKC